MSTYPARIIYRAAPAELLDQVKAELGEGIEPFIFSAEISSNRLDAYYGHMGESTLRNFATDAAAGVPFLDSHNNRNLGYGQSFTGTFEAEGDISRVISDFFTIPGIHFGGGLTYQSTDDFILAKKARLSPDVSVGFYGGDEICDICGKSVWDFWRDMPCPHMPGIEYAIGDRGNETILATFTVEDSHLAEVSNVYDGATPEAMILKARHQIETGKLQPQAARLLETRYRIKLPGTERQAWSGVDTNGKGKLIMTEPIKTESNEPKAEVLTELRAILTEAKAPEGAEADGVRWLVTELQGAQTEVTRLTAEVQRLQPLADDGKQYRTDLITETLAEGVRAMGDSFPEETYRGMLENGTSIEAIKKMRDAFAQQAEGRLSKGRQTVDDDQLQTDQKPQPDTSNVSASAA